MNLLIRLWLMALCVCLTAGAMCGMTLEQAQTAAQERYPLTKDYNLISLTEQFTVENAAKAWLPQVGVGAQATWQSAVASYPEALKEMLEQRGLEMKGLGKFQYKASVEVTQTIWDGGAVKASQDVARAEAKEQTLANDVELYSLRERINQLYFSILLLEQQLDALTSTQDLLTSNLGLVEALLRNGAAMQSDADAVEVEKLAVEQQVASVTSSIGAYRKMLALYTGFGEDDALEMPEEKNVYDNDDFSGRPEWGLLSARMSTLDARRRQVDASVMPRVGAFAQGYFGYPGMNFMAAMLERKPGFNAMIGISATWNLSNLYTKKNRLRILETQRERIATARNVFDFNAGLQATQQRQEIRRLHEMSLSDSRIVELRTRVRRASEAQLREGIVMPVDLLLRITDEKNAVIAANTHRIEYLMAIYRLDNLLDNTRK